MKWTNNPSEEWNEIFPKKTPRIMRGMLYSNLTGVHGRCFGEVARIDPDTVLILHEEPSTFIDRYYSWSICKEGNIFSRLSTEEALRILFKKIL